MNEETKKTPRPIKQRTIGQDEWRRLNRAAMHILKDDVRRHDLFLARSWEHGTQVIR